MKYHYLLPLLLLLALAGLVPLYAVQAQDLGGRADPPRGGVGTTFTFSASGFGSSERIETWLEKPDGSIQTLLNTGNRFADPDGNYVWTWTAGEFAPGGEWTAVARGQVNRQEARIPFVVENDLGNQPPSSWMAIPESAPPGTTFTFVGRSPAFIPGEQLSSWFIQPDGSTLNVAQGMSVDPTGQFYRLWKAPDDLYGGRWTFRVVGISSGFNIDIPFTIEAPPAPPAPEVPVILDVTPASGAPGTTFSFTANGFVPEELVSHWLVMPDGRAIDVPEPWLSANGEGVFSWQWTAPPDTAAGTWRYRMSGTQTAGQKEIVFEVTGGNPTPDRAATGPGSMQPPFGPPDTPFTIRVSGFTPNEILMFWAERSDGKLIANEFEPRADSSGSAEWLWEAPNAMQPGDWTLVVRGRVSEIRIQIPFRITDPANPPQPASVAPEVGLPGTTFFFYTNGYNSGELLDIWASGPGGRTYNFREGTVDRETANRKGEVLWSWTTPADMVAGQWQMIIRGFDSREQSIIPFTLVRNEPPAVELPYSITPARGGPGTTFTFAAEGFQPRERVSVWLSQPDGTVVRVFPDSVHEADEIGSDEAGRVQFSWTAPLDAPRGVWNLRMQTSRPEDIDEDIRYVIRFVIE